jgi:hypothetical protein
MPTTAPTARSAFPLSGPINLHARLGHGSVTVTARDDITEAVVTMTARGSATAGQETLDRVTVEMDGPTLSIAAPRQGGIFDMISSWRREQDAVDLTVLVPTSTAVKISTFTATINVIGRCGGADIASGGATITLDHVAGNLLLRYGNGNSDVNQVDGDATIRSGSGNVRIGEIGGALQAGCGSGGLEVGSVRGSVRSRAGSGDAVLSAVYGNVDLASGSGSVSIGLPSGVVARLEATTGSGRVETQLAIDERPVSPGPSIRVRARTGSGNIRIFRAA